ncbi:hypothetical protein [Alloalcanivorax venustensis]|uniref:hypothetical protein n=1 Tax=Alloalcanivorax venustensis TaxID=172371 RepID=UPI00351847E3
MKKSLISKKDLVEGNSYWCMYNDFKVLYLMKYRGNGIFDRSSSSAGGQDIRVMFEGYTNTNKSRIPKKYLVVSRHYWCKRRDEDELSLMRLEKNGSFYSKAHDVFWPQEDIKVIFEDYEQ